MQNEDCVISSVLVAQVAVATMEVRLHCSPPLILPEILFHSPSPSVHLTILFRGPEFDLFDLFFKLEIFITAKISTDPPVNG